MSDSSEEHVDLDLSLLTDGVNAIIFKSSQDEISSLKTASLFCNALYQPDSLVNLGCKAVAEKRPFEVIYTAEKPIPEHIQKRIAQFSFPSTEKEIRMYSCLGTGDHRCFNEALDIMHRDSVCDCIQIGFYISANVIRMNKALKPRHVTLCFDRKHITFTSCTCVNEEDYRPIASHKEYLTSSQKPMSDKSVWCRHVVATCLTRLRHPQHFTYRPPILESLNQLNETQLRTLAYKLICQEGAERFLPATQSILDEMLLPDSAPFEAYVEGRDPTGGGNLDESPYWCADFTNLKNRLAYQLNHICDRCAETGSDFMTSELPSQFLDILDILSSVRSYRPRGAWDLLSIIVKMMHSHDVNAFEVLLIFSESILDVPKVLKCWNCLERNLAGRLNNACCTAAWLCEALVDVLRLFCLNPNFSSDPQVVVPSLGVSREGVAEILTRWQSRAIFLTQDRNPEDNGHPGNNSTNQLEFVGFNSAIQACSMTWSNELPPTHSLTSGQFKEVMPDFDGAFVSTSTNDATIWRDSFEDAPLSGSPFYPPMHGRFGADFARCQGLVTHRADRDVALAWVRHLALQLLQQSPHLVSAAEKASMHNSEVSVQIQPSSHALGKTDHRSSSLTILNTEAKRRPRNLNQEKDDCASADLRNMAFAKFAETLTEWIYCVEYLMDCFYSFHFHDGVVCPPMLTNHHLTRVVLARKERYGFYNSYYLPHLTASNIPPQEVDESGGWLSVDIELAFRLGFLVLALPRPQLLLKSREVRFMDHESQLMARLFRLPVESVCPRVIDSLRKEAQILVHGAERAVKFDAASVPYGLSEFLFTMLSGSESTQIDEEDSLDVNHEENTSENTNHHATTPNLQPLALRIDQSTKGRIQDYVPSQEVLQQVNADQELAFALVKRTLSRKSPILDVNFTRCQRYQQRCFILKVFDYYKKQTARISSLTDSFLDRALNRSFKCPSLQVCLESNLQEMLAFRPDHQQPHQRISQRLSSSSSRLEANLAEEDVDTGSNEALKSNVLTAPTTNAGSTSEDTDTVSESRIRCANLRRLTRHSVGMAAVDSSAPETTSSDNSPATSRRAFRVPEEILTPPPIPGYSSSGEDGQFAILESCHFSPDSKILTNNGDPLPRLYLGQEYVEYLADLAKKVREMAGGPNPTYFEFDFADGPTNTIGLYALGLCNHLSGARKSRLMGKIESWLSQEALDIDQPAIFALIHSWRNAFSIQEVTNVVKQFVRRYKKNSSPLVAVLCHSILPECVAEGPKFLLTFIAKLRGRPGILQYVLNHLERNEALILKAPGFSAYRSEYFYSLATIWLHLLDQHAPPVETHRWLVKSRIPPAEHHVTGGQMSLATGPSLYIYPQMQTSLTPQDITPITTEYLHLYISRVIPDSSNLDLDWSEEEVVASLSDLSEPDQKPRTYLLRALRLLLLSIDEKLPIQTQSNRSGFLHTLCHPRHRYEHCGNMNASQVIDEKLLPVDSRNRNWGSHRAVNRPSEDPGFNSPLDQSVLRAFCVAEALEDEESIVLVCLWLLHRITCPILLSVVTLKAIKIFNALNSQPAVDEVIARWQQQTLVGSDSSMIWTDSTYQRQQEQEIVPGGSAGTIPRISMNRLSIPLLECLFNWTCQLFYNQLERRSGDWREIIDMSLSVHLFYREAPQWVNLRISWETFSCLINHINPSVFGSIKSVLESIGLASFKFPPLSLWHPLSSIDEIDVDWTSLEANGANVAPRQCGNGRPNDRRQRAPRTRGRGAVANGRTNNFTNRR
ncbi:hypothetical protein Aperf_G00000085339 [Anoplocephala perfoliata]